jgi:hypothetical protein
MRTPHEFASRFEYVASAAFPACSGLRLMMMPFRMDDVERTVPYAGYAALVRRMIEKERHEGVGYLTIDEARVPAGEMHRRPGLHVDGLAEDGSPGGWGGPRPGGWGHGGFLVAASRTGSAAWRQRFDGYPGKDGDCEHLRDQADESCRRLLHGGSIYRLEPLTVHESLSLPIEIERQFVRVSLPNACPWYEGYTESPVGVAPTGPIRPRRAAQMAHRPSA